jgi:hypothetical protein
VLVKLRGLALLAFGLADNHLHLLLACARELAAQLAKVVELSLRRRLALPVPFGPAHLTPVEDSRHLDRAFRYVLRQPERHGIDGDPHREASSLPDLLGLRPLGGFTAANVRRELPRIKRHDLLELLGVADLQPADGPVEWTVEATLAAAALPSLAGTARAIVVARRAALSVLSDRVPPRRAAEALGICDRTLRRTRRAPVDAALVEAIRGQLRLRLALPSVSPSSFAVRSVSQP